jgi:hypothetical protein
VTDGFVDVLLGILLLVQVARRAGEPGVAEAEVRIEGNRPRKTLARLLVLGSRHRFCGACVLTNDFQRGRRQRFHGEPFIAV